MLLQPSFHVLPTQLHTLSGWVVLAVGDGRARTELTFTPPQAAEIARALLATCNRAYADRVVVEVRP